MQRSYQGYGVRFRFPESWEVSEERSGGDVSIAVNSPETSFWSVTLCFDKPAPERLMSSAVQAFQEEYENPDVYPVEAEVCHRRALGRDIEFFCFELLNSAYLRAFRAGRFTALILYQGTDHELQETRETMEEISRSLECVEDESLFG